MLYPFAGRSALVAAAMLFQNGQQIPPPSGLVNDFANVLPAVSVARMERIVREALRSRSERGIAAAKDRADRRDERAHRANRALATATDETGD